MNEAVEIRKLELDSVAAHQKAERASIMIDYYGQSIQKPDFPFQYAYGHDTHTLSHIIYFLACSGINR